jgi:hypothetical protein
VDSQLRAVVQELAAGIRILLHVRSSIDATDLNVV